MDPYPVPDGIVILAGIAVAVAAVCHWRLRGFWRASLVSAVAAPLLFFVASLVQERGVPAPLSLEAFALFCGFSLLVAVVVGAGAILTRRLKAKPLRGSA